MVVNAEKTIQDINNLKKISYRRNRRPNETWLDFYYKSKGGKCDYCKRKDIKKRFRLVKKFNDSKSKRISENRNNIVLICDSCRRMKKNMNHKEFKDYIKNQKKINRSSVTNKTKKIVFKEYNEECIYCVFEYGFTPSNRKLTVDHKKPIGQMGTSNVKNLGCSCYEHNVEKGNRDANEYFEFLTLNNRKKKKGFIN